MLSEPRGIKTDVFRVRANIHHKMYVDMYDLMNSIDAYTCLMIIKKL